MAKVSPQEFVADGPEGVSEDARPAIYMAGPTPENETELGPVMEKIVEKFANTTDFVDPTAIHERGGGGDDNFLDIDASRWWKGDGSFDRQAFDKERAKYQDDSLVVDIMRGDIDDALGFDGYVESFLDTIDAFNPIEGDIPTGIEPNLNPLPPTPFFEFDFLPFDINIFGGILGVIKKILFGSILSSDGVMVSRKAGNNMVGAAMEVKHAFENDIPVAVYDHSDVEDNKPIPVMLDQHADYVTNKPEWAAAWLIDEAQRRKEKEPEKVDTNE